MSMETQSSTGGAGATTRSADSRLNGNLGPGAVGAATTVETAAPKRNMRKRLIAGVVILVGIIGVLAWYLLHAGLEDTDDAQVEADVVSVPARTAGVVLQVNFVENQPVKAGEVLAELDSSLHKARLAQAEAELQSAQASADAADAQVSIVDASSKGQKSQAEAALRGSKVTMTTTGDEIEQAKAAVAAATATRHQAEIDLNRDNELFSASAIPRQRLDAAQTAFDAADAALAQARARLSGATASTDVVKARIGEAQARVTQMSAVPAQIAEARARAATAHARVQVAQAARDAAALDLSYTKILAPSDGIASKKSVVVGQMIQIGQPVVQLVPSKEVWVVANFKETQLARVQAGQHAEVEIDAYPGLKLDGEVQSLSGATGSRFSLLPPDNATGNFTKVVQRVPVRIHIAKLPLDKVLRPGMSAEVTVHVK